MKLSEMSTQAAAASACGAAAFTLGIVIKQLEKEE